MLAPGYYYKAEPTNKERCGYCWARSIIWLRKNISKYIPNYTDRGSFRLYIVNEKGEKTAEFLEPEKQLWLIKD